jgi:hypothetical protein
MDMEGDDLVTLYFQNPEWRSHQDQTAPTVFHYKFSSHMRPLGVEATL